MQSSKDSPAAWGKKVWIDLDNSPHVPFFAPIIEELKKRNYSVVITARDAYQVCELADLFHFNYKLVGHHYGKRKILKVYGTAVRALQLLPFASKEKPDIAVSHGSRSQLFASALVGIPCLNIFDYEFTKQLGFIKPTWEMAPEVVASAKGSGLLTYPGIKEDVYAPQFRPDDAIRSVLWLNKDDIVVTVRPPASEAHYHNPKSDELFSATMKFLGKAPGVKVILLPRNGGQANSIRQTWADLFASGKAVIPDHPVDGLNLIWHSDLVISGGGTMNREAAALGVPVYSIFRGKIGAVDRYLSNNGRLVLVEGIEDVRNKIILNRRPRSLSPKSGDKATLNQITDKIVALVESIYKPKR